MSNTDLSSALQSDRAMKKICLLGGIAAMVVLAGAAADIVIGNIVGADPPGIAGTAVERFSQFRESALAGLYHLDFLNTVIQLFMVPMFFALCVFNLKSSRNFSILAFALFLLGTTVFIANNAALPMLDLSGKYFSASDESARTAYAAAGEALLASGGHDSAGSFFAFFIPNAAILLISAVMLKGGIFGKINSWTGIAGAAFMIIYTFAVKFTDISGSVKILIAMPGGLCMMAWIVLMTVRMFRLSFAFRKQEPSE